MVRYGLIVAVTLLLPAAAGCGGGAAAPRASRTPSATATTTPAAAKAAGPTSSKAPVLVQMTMQRPGALLDKITIHTDGYALFDRPSGGVGRVQRDVIIEPAVLRRLRASLRRIHGDGGRPGGEPAPNFATYIMRYRGRTMVAKQGAEPRELRAPMRTIRAMLLDGEGFAKVTRERLGGVAGATHLSGVGKDRKAPVLVFFQRQGAGGATLDTFTVRRDGSGRLEKRYGGAGGRFKDLELRPGVLPRLKAALARLPRSGGSLTEGSPPPGGAQYLLRFGGRTFTAREGGVVAEARPAVRILDGLIDGIGVRRVTRENATGRP
jgi:hypothetical protein